MARSIYVYKRVLMEQRATQTTTLSKLPPTLRNVRVKSPNVPRTLQNQYMFTWMG